jgi:fructosamine-3-kinase
MAAAECAGLKAIAATKAIRTPEILHCGAYEKSGCLLLEFIEAQGARIDHFAVLARQLAALHKTTNDTFGWTNDNFIGRLPQRNSQDANWTAFYLESRLIPQLMMARDHGLLSATDIPDDTKMLSVFEELFSGVTPSLLHGDLWNGNYLISTDGTPYLIDPAVYYGHSEVDLAMSLLFGGFGESFYAAYHEIIPATPGMDERIGIYQLYYLLVHLNLFGAAYYERVKQGLRRFE